jgi:hypothetical protein
MTIPHTATLYTPFQDVHDETCPISMERARNINELACFIGPNGRPRAPFYDAEALLQWTAQHHTWPHNRQPADYNPNQIDALGLTGRYRRHMPLPQQIARTENLLRKGRAAYLKHFYRRLNDPSLLETPNDMERAKQFRTFMVHESCDAYAFAQPSDTIVPWLSNYWKAHPYDSEQDEDIPKPSPHDMRDEDAPFVHDQQLLDEWHQFRQNMAELLAPGPMHTDDAVYDYWFSHPINMQVDDHRTISTFDTLVNGNFIEALR